MRTKTLNVYEEQNKWMRQHYRADRLLCDENGRAIKAIYLSPLEQWKGMMAPDGTVNVPDMDHYNSLTDESDITQAIEELKDGGILSFGR